MQSTVRNISGGALTIPALGTSNGTFNLLDGQAKNFVYSTIGSTQRTTLLSLASAGSVDFPGGADDFGFTGDTDPGLQDKKFSYTLNGQEPVGEPVGTQVFSILDNAYRIWNGATWALTNGGDYWEIIKKNIRPKGGQLLAISNTKAMMVHGAGVWKASLDNWVFRPAFLFRNTIPGENEIAGDADDIGPYYGDRFVDPFHIPHAPTNRVSEIFDIATKKWTVTAAAAYTHGFAAAAVLPSGKVLVVGGGVIGTDSWYTSFSDGKGNVQADGVAIIHGHSTDLGAKAEIYDPATNTWSATDELPCVAAAPITYKVGTPTISPVVDIGNGSNRDKVTVADASGFAVNDVVFIGFDVYNQYNLKTITDIKAPHGNTAYSGSGSGTLVMNTVVDAGIEQDSVGNLHVTKTQEVTRAHKGVRWIFSQPSYKLGSKILFFGGQYADLITPLTTLRSDGILEDAATFAGEETNRVWLYDEAAAPGSKWTAAANYPVATVLAHGSVLSNGKLLAIAGDSAADVYLYDPTANTWTQKAAMPSIQDPEDDDFTFSIDDNALVLDDGNPGWRDTDAIVAMSGNKVLVAGGFYSGQADHSQSGERKSCIVYDLASNTWTRIGDLLGVTVTHPFASGPMYWDAAKQGGLLRLNDSDNEIYFIGGHNCQNMTMSSAVYHLDTATMTWEFAANLPTHPGGLGGNPAQNIYGINCGILTNDFEFHLNRAIVGLRYKGVSHILGALGTEPADNFEYFFRDTSRFVGSDVQPLQFNESILYTPGAPGKSGTHSKKRLRPTSEVLSAAEKNQMVLYTGAPYDTGIAGKRIAKKRI